MLGLGRVDLCRQARRWVGVLESFMPRDRKINNHESLPPSRRGPEPSRPIDNFRRPRVFQLIRPPSPFFSPPEIREGAARQPRNASYFFFRQCPLFPPASQLHSVLLDFALAGWRGGERTACHRATTPLCSCSRFNGEEGEGWRRSAAMSCQNKREPAFEEGGRRAVAHSHHFLELCSVWPLICLTPCPYPSLLQLFTNYG